MQSFPGRQKSVPVSNKNRIPRRRKINSRFLHQIMKHFEHFDDAQARFWRRELLRSLNHGSDVL